MNIDEVLIAKITKSNSKKKIEILAIKIKLKNSEYCEHLTTDVVLNIA